VLASAYDFTGQPLWHAPVDVAPVPPVPTGKERLVAALQPSGVVRVDLQSGRAAEIDGQGKVRWLAR
jgi:hypothetical protein